MNRVGTASRARGSRRVLVAGAALIAWAGVSPAPAQAAVPDRQELVVLVSDEVARSRASLDAPVVSLVTARLPLTRLRTTLPVLERRVSPGGRRWARVLLPGRPNGHSGWIPTLRTRRSFTEWALAVDLSDREVTVRRNGRVERRFRAVIGAPSTPTPRGRFYVEEALALRPDAAGGPFALAMSARSNVLQEFNGGPGQIAIHGTNHLFDPFGSAASHGCIRLSARAVTWLAQRVGRGVMVRIS